MNELPSPAAPVTVAVSPPAALPSLTPSDLAKLAREVVMQIRDLDDILAAFCITPEQYAAIAALPFFKHALEAISIEWNSSLSTAQRIKLSSQAILEDSLTKLGARMTDEKETLPAVVEAGKLFAKLGGVGEADKSQTIGEKFTININLGGDNKLAVEVGAATPSEEPPTITLRANPEGSGSETAVPSLPKGS